MIKKLFFFINIVMILIVDNNIISGQYINTPLTMGDYILRSCIASVVLIRNHRKSQLSGSKSAKDNSMILNDNLIRRKGASMHTNSETVQRNSMWHVRDKTSVDTPLRTLDIKKERTRDLIFTKKNNFPEISPRHYNDDKKEKNTKIIVIKSVNRGAS